MQSVIREKSYGSAKVFWINKRLLLQRLGRAAQRIAAERKDVEKIVLFGSQARGTATAYSDADIVMVVTHSEKRFLDRADEFRKYFKGAQVSVDIFVYTRQEADAALKGGNAFLASLLSGAGTGRNRARILFH